MKNFEKIMGKVRADKTTLAKKYNTDASKVVWMGENKYAVVTLDGKQFVITV